MNFGVPVYVGPRRSRKKFTEQARQNQLMQQADAFAKRGQIEETISRFEQSGMPVEIKQLLRMQLEALSPREVPDLPSDAELQANELDALAEQFTGTYFEKKAEGWKIWNFQALVSVATMIESKPVHLFEIETPGAVYELAGETAVAFQRYLHYIGLMLLESNKLPCPVCSSGPPQDCIECGGLGWILKTVLKED